MDCWVREREGGGRWNAQGGAILYKLLIIIFVYFIIYIC